MAETEGTELQPVIPVGHGGCKTQYTERKNFEDAAKANYVPPKKKFRPNERVCKEDIDKIDKARQKSKLSTLEEITIEDK